MLLQQLIPARTRLITRDNSPSRLRHDIPVKAPVCLNVWLPSEARSFNSLRDIRMPSVRFSQMRTTGSLSCRHGFRRSHGQLQRLAQCRQVRIPWTNAIVLPEVNAGLTDTDLLGAFGNG